VIAMGLEPLKAFPSPQCIEATKKAHIGRRSYAWKGGRRKDNYGYIQIWKPKHPNAKMKGYIHEHRLKMSQKLGRPLEKHENVHHKNGKRDDNRMSNLELWSTMQPAGQRVRDKVLFAKEIIKLYGKSSI